MIAETSEPQTAYPVEVSGWDEHEDFFVEKTELHWSEQSGKHILLLRPIVSGALVFLRLIDPLSIDRARPVPYRAELFETMKVGKCRVRLLSADLVTTWGAGQLRSEGCRNGMNSGEPYPIGTSEGFCSRKVCQPDCVRAPGEMAFR
jgi:hypothetical protein